MGKRVLATGLWFIAAWMVSAMVAYLIDLPLGAVAIAACAVAVLVGADPLRVLWAANPRTS